ncbi:hypothetical protein NHQ30_002063 [Ciborinia camelliae]|nr:hypothetical protein NHQ30_002063 [Ciborinia camelliae]
MEGPKDDNSSTVVNISENGDVILVVGPEKKKFRVHSLFLKAASKPFFAMFRPDWKEGHDMLDQNGPAEVSLPEDNATALEIILAIIHHQKNKVPQTLAASDVLEVAVTADKYDFVDALKLAIGNWLHPDEKEVRDLMRLAAAAYLFRDARAFKKITKALILEHENSYLDLSCEEIESVMDWSVFCE